jgi:hypothetical protein
MRILVFLVAASMLVVNRGASFVKILEYVAEGVK